ncbi:MAG: hypothetical protein ACJAZO_000507 [Myxococcota bacterium]|jgi:hypothetical protein
MMSDNTNGSMTAERLAELGLDAEDYARIERTAMFSAILGFICQLCAVLACCGPLFISGPGVVLGIVALVLAKGVLDSGVDGAPGAYARTSIAMSVIGVAWCGFVSLLCCAYFGLYGLGIAIGLAGNM